MAAGGSQGSPGPDVLVVVLDCVRASDFPGGESPVGGMRFCEKLFRETTRFPRAVAPAPWTIPSHASLFTGLYPWEHNVHMRGELKLDPGIPNIADLLGRLGYSSFSISANGFICPEMGLVDSFGSAAWGAWWERYLRRYDRGSPPYGKNLNGAELGTPTAHATPAWVATLEQRAWLVHRIPWLLDIGNRIVQSVSNAPTNSKVLVSPWVEETIRRWLDRQPRSQPVFGFVNLLDAHEPYLTDPDLRTGLTDWFRHVRVRMDRSSALTGQWLPSETELRMLHDLYRHMIQTLDRRVEGVVRAFQDAGRWDGTLMVLTSDHGQSFGEHGHLFHGLRIWESLLRVPLWVKWPDGERADRDAVGWASLVDVAPTVVEAAGLSNGYFRTSVPLGSLIDQPRSGPVLAMSDGIQPRDPIRRRSPPERLADIDRIWVAAYEGDRKLLYDATRKEFSAYDVLKDPNESIDLWPKEQDQLEGLMDAVLRAADQIVKAPAHEMSDDVTNRLRSWGYME